jgi:hypothetical protein
MRSRVERRGSGVGGESGGGVAELEVLELGSEGTVEVEREVEHQPVRDSVFVVDTGLTAVVPDAVDVLGSRGSSYSPSIPSNTVNGGKITVRSTETFRSAGQ